MTSKYLLASVKIFSKNSFRKFTLQIVVQFFVFISIFLLRSSLLEIIKSLFSCQSFVKYFCNQACFIRIKSELSLFFKEDISWFSSNLDSNLEKSHKSHNLLLKGSASGTKFS